MQVKAQMSRMVIRNSNLAIENDRLLKQLHSPGNILKKDSLTKQDSRGFMSLLSKSKKKK